MQSNEVASEQIDNLVNMIDGYAEKGGHHLNVNVFTKDTLLDAQAHPREVSSADHSRFWLRC